MTYQNHSFAFALRVVQLYTIVRICWRTLVVNIPLIICHIAKAALAVMGKPRERDSVPVRREIIADIADLIIDPYRLGIERRSLVGEQIVVYRRHFRRDR